MTKKVLRLVVGALFTTLALVGTALVSPASAAPAPPSDLARTVYYSASGYSAEADQAAQIRNSGVPNLRMVRGGSATIRIHTTTGGGSRAYPCGLGCATIYIDSRDIAAGHSSLRIVAHEIGYGLGGRRRVPGRDQRAGDAVSPESTGLRCEHFAGGVRTGARVPRRATAVHGSHHAVRTGRPGASTATPCSPSGCPGTTVAGPIRSPSRTTGGPSSTSSGSPCPPA